MQFALQRWADMVRVVYFWKSDQIREGTQIDITRWRLEGGKVKMEVELPKGIDRKTTTSNARLLKEEDN